MYSYCVVENSCGVTRAVKSGKNVKRTEQFNMKYSKVVSLNCYILKYN